MSQKKKVIIMGGGVAGMSAAHELIERGFDVQVFEKKVQLPGGKARSVNVPDFDAGEHYNPLPGEHGFRFFPGFYKRVIDTVLLQGLTRTLKLEVCNNNLYNQCGYNKSYFNFVQFLQ